jgi:uncharacterized phage protein gp47/JayE
MPILNTKTKEQMLINALDSLQKNAGISSISPGSIARAFAEAITTEIADLYSSFKISVEQSSLALASGKNLDAIGELYNVSRRSIADELITDRITSNIQFYLTSPYSSDITIPSGTLVYNNVDNFNDIQYAYELSGSVLIQSGATSVYGAVKAKYENTGITAARDTLVKHNFIAPPGAVVFCTNPKEVYAAINAEADDNYRKRIVSAIRGSSSGTAESIRFAALSVKGVKDVKIKEGSYGIGSCDLLIVPESPSSLGNIPEIVYTAVSGAKPLGIRINTRVAIKKSVDVSVTLTLKQGTSSQAATAIEMQARIFLIRYLNSLTIGSSISVQEMESQAKYSSDFIVGVTVNNLSVDKKSVPNVNYRLSDDKSYMGAGAVGVYSVIIGSSGY